MADTSVGPKAAISSQRCPGAKSRHPVPSLLAAPYRVITGLPDCVRRKLGVCGLEFLKAHDVRLAPSKPAEQVRQRRLMLLMLKLAIFIGFGQRSDRIELARMALDHPSVKNLAKRASYGKVYRADRENAKSFRQGGEVAFRAERLLPVS